MKRMSVRCVWLSFVAVLMVFTLAGCPSSSGGDDDMSAVIDDGDLPVTKAGSAMNAILKDGGKLAAAATATSFKPSTKAPASGVMTYTLSADDSVGTVLAWLDGSTIYYYAEGGKKIKLAADSSRLFAGCSKLETIDVSGFDTSDVSNMAGMFTSCTALTAIKGLDGFNTGKVTSMNGMFLNCGAITSIDVSSFDTGNVTTMQQMFKYCSALASITGLGKFKTDKVTRMDEMFTGCSELASLNVRFSNTGAVTNMGSMFCGCSSLTAITRLDTFSTGNVTNMEGMFESCSKLTSLDVSSVNTSKVTGMDSMFANCTALKTIYASDSFSTDAVTSSSGMFFGCDAPLTGGAGTTYDSMHVDAAYAHIDVAGNPGYFTKK